MPNLSSISLSPTEVPEVQYTRSQESPSESRVRANARAVKNIWCRPLNHSVSVTLFAINDADSVGELLYLLDKPLVETINLAHFQDKPLTDSSQLAWARSTFGWNIQKAWIDYSRGLWKPVLYRVGNDEFVSTRWVGWLGAKISIPSECTVAWWKTVDFTIRYQLVGSMS